MMSFKEFLAEAGGSPDYPSNSDPEVIAAAAKGGVFRLGRDAWKTDEEITAQARLAWDISHRLGLFEQWLVKTFGVLENKIDIHGYFAVVNSFRQWHIKLVGPKWKRDDGFAIEMMMKKIPKKWAELLPDFSLQKLTLNPVFDVADERTKTYNIYSSWFPIEYESKRKVFNRYTLRSTTLSEEKFVAHGIANYSHHRLGAYTSELYDRQKSEWLASRPKTE